MSTRDCDKISGEANVNFGITGVDQKEELLKQLKTISEALNKQTEKKVKKYASCYGF